MTLWCAAIGQHVSWWGRVIPPHLTLNPSNISVYQCLVVVMRSHSRAGQTSPDYELCQSSPGETRQRQRHNICLHEQPYTEVKLLLNWCQSPVNMIKHTRTHTHTISHDITFYLQTFESRCLKVGVLPDEVVTVCRSGWLTHGLLSILHTFQQDKNFVMITNSAHWKPTVHACEKHTNTHSGTCTF